MLRNTLIGAIALISVSFAYYHVIFLPNSKEKIKSEILIPAQSFEKKETTILPVTKISKKSTKPAPQIPISAKNAELEIEKCKTKLTEGFPLGEVLATLNEIFPPRMKALREKQREAFNLLTQCLNSEAGKSDKGRELCQIPISAINAQIEALSKESEDTMRDLIKQQQQRNYKDCLNSI